MVSMKMMVICTTLGALVACAETRERSDDFGNSVREMIQMQTAHPDAGKQALPPGQRTLDGQKAAAVMRSYHRGSNTLPAPDAGAAPATTDSATQASPWMAP